MIRFFFLPPFKMADFSAKTAPGTSPTVRFWPPYSGPPDLTPSHHSCWEAVLNASRLRWTLNFSMQLLYAMHPTTSMAQIYTRPWIRKLKILSFYFVHDFQCFQTRVTARPTVETWAEPTASPALLQKSVLYSARAQDGPHEMESNPCTTFTGDENHNFGTPKEL